MFPWLKSTRKDLNLSDSKAQEIVDLKKDVDNLVPNSKNLQQQRRALAKEKEQEDRNRKLDLVKSQILGGEQLRDQSVGNSRTEVGKKLAPTNKLQYYEQGVQTKSVSESETETDFGKGGKFYGEQTPIIHHKKDGAPGQSSNNIFFDKEKAKNKMWYDENDGFKITRKPDVETVNNEGFEKRRDLEEAAQDYNDRSKGRKMDKMEYGAELKRMIEEKKRRKKSMSQDERSLDKMIIDQNLKETPFGKSGGGAPVKDTGGNLLSRYGYGGLGSMHRGEEVNKKYVAIAEHIPRAFRRNSGLVDLKEEKKVTNEYMIRGVANNVKLGHKGVSDPSQFQRSDSLPQNNGPAFDGNSYQNNQSENLSDGMNSMQYPQGQSMAYPQGQGMAYPQGQGMAFPQGPSHVAGQYAQMLNQSPNSISHGQTLTPEEASQQGDPSLYKPPGVDAYDDLEKEFLMRTHYDITFNLREKGKLMTREDLLKLRKQALQELYQKELDIKKQQEVPAQQKSIENYINIQNLRQAELDRQREVHRREEEALKAEQEDLKRKYLKDIFDKQMEMNMITEMHKMKNEDPPEPVPRLSRIPEPEIKFNKKPPPREDPPEPTEEDIEADERIRENKRKLDVLEERKREEEYKRKILEEQRIIFEEYIKRLNLNLSGLREDMLAQQNSLNQELLRLKNEALLASEQRNTNYILMAQMKEQLRQQELLEDLRLRNLRIAMDKNEPPRKIVIQGDRYFNSDDYLTNVVNFRDWTRGYVPDSLDHFVEKSSYVPLNRNLGDEKLILGYDNIHHEPKPDIYTTIKTSNNLTKAIELDDEIFPKVPLIIERKDVRQPYISSTEDVKIERIYRTNEDRFNELEKMEHRITGVPENTKVRLDYVIEDYYRG